MNYCPTITTNIYRVCTLGNIVHQNIFTCIGHSYSATNGTLKLYETYIRIYIKPIGRNNKSNFRVSTYHRNSITMNNNRHTRMILTTDNVDV